MDPERCILNANTLARAWIDGNGQNIVGRSTFKFDKTLTRTMWNDVLDHLRKDGSLTMQMRKGLTDKVNPAMVLRATKLLVQSREFFTLYGEGCRGADSHAGCPP